MRREADQPRQTKQQAQRPGGHSLHLRTVKSSVRLECAREGEGQPGARLGGPRGPWWELWVYFRVRRSHCRILS